MDERALLEVAFCADSTWTNGYDPYQQANKQLLQKVLKSKIAVDNQENYLKPEIKMPPSAEDRSKSRNGAKTVRDVIPTSRLASYGNYEYNQVLESLYASDFSSAQYHFDCPKSDPEEVWMLQEVEDLFKKYTAPLSSGASGISSSEKTTHGCNECPTSKTQTKNDVDSFFRDKCSITTESELALAERIRCDAVKRLWDTPFPDTPCTRRTSNIPPGPRKHTSTASSMDSKTSAEYFLARQYQLWGTSYDTDYVPLPIPTRKNPYSLFEHNDIVVATKKSTSFFPSSSEVSDSGELFPYLDVGLPIPTHTPSYAIPVIQPSQQTRAHSSGSPPTAKRIPVYQRPVEQHVDRRRHGADLSNLICLSKRGERHTEDEPTSPGVDADSDSQVSSEINWLLMNYHPRVNPYQQLSNSTDELSVIERQLDEGEATGSVTSPERTVEPSGVKLELEKDFPPITLSQKRVKSKMRKLSGPTPTPISELSVDVNGVWGPRRTYKDACLNETQLSPDSAGGFGQDGEDEYDDDEPLPDSIPDSFWAPIVKGELRYGERGFVDHKENWPALADPSLRRSPVKLEEVKDDESDKVSVKELKIETLCPVVEIEEVQESEVDETNVEADAVEVVAQEVEVVVTSRRSDEDLANKYQELEEQALETIAGISRDDGEQVQEDDGDGADITVAFEEPSLLDALRLVVAPGVDVGESSSDDDGPILRWTTPTSDADYVIAVGFEPRTRRRSTQSPAPQVASVLKSFPKDTVPIITAPCTHSPPRNVSNDAVDVDDYVDAADITVVADTADSTLSRASSTTTILDDSAAPSTKPAWLKQPRKKPANRRKPSVKTVAKPKPDNVIACTHTNAATDRKALLKIERDMKQACPVACRYLFQFGFPMAHRKNKSAGVETRPSSDIKGLLMLLHFTVRQPLANAGHCPMCAWDFAREILPSACPSCLEKVGDVVERIREHVRLMEATNLDAATESVRTALGCLTRLGEFARADNDWDCQIERYIEFYELRHNTFLFGTPPLFDSILPVLAYSYQDDASALRSRWPRREETVCLRRTIFLSPTRTLLLSQVSSTSECGISSVSTYSTTFTHNGVEFYHPADERTPSPSPLRVHDLAAPRVMLRLGGAVSRFLSGEAGVWPPLRSTAPVQSVGTQTDCLCGRNRIKALSKQMFQPLPPPPKVQAPAQPNMQPPAQPNIQPTAQQNMQPPAQPNTQALTQANMQPLPAQVPAPPNRQAPSAVIRARLQGHPARPAVAGQRLSRIRCRYRLADNVACSMAKGSSVQSAGSVPTGSMPAGSVPVQNTTPASSLPVGSVPAGSVTASSVPADLVPASSAPAGLVPTSSMPVNTMPASSLPLGSVSVPTCLVPTSSVSAGPEPGTSMPDTKSAPVGHLPAQSESLSAATRLGTTRGRPINRSDASASEADSRRSNAARPPRSLTPMPQRVYALDEATSSSTQPAEAAASRKSSWIPEPLRKASARIFKRAGRKLGRNVNGAVVRPEVVSAENPQANELKGNQDSDARIGSALEKSSSLVGAQASGVPSASRTEDDVDRTGHVTPAPGTLLLGVAGKRDAIPTPTPEATPLVSTASQQTTAAPGTLLLGVAGNGDAVPTLTPTPKTPSDQATVVEGPLRSGRGDNKGAVN